MGVVTRFSKITPAKKWEPLIPLDTLVDGLKYKQQLFDKNANLVQSQLDQGAQLASQIDNLEIRKQYQTDFNNLVTNINTNFSTADLTKQDVMGKVNEQGRSIAENQLYAQGLAMSRHFRDQDKLITESKTEDGGKYYNPSAEYVVNKNYNTFKNASIKDYNKAQLTEYMPYYDTKDSELKLIDKIKPDVESELTNMGFDKSSDLYMQRVEKLTKDRVQSAMIDLYQNDPKALRQLQFDYEYTMDTNPVDINEHAQGQFKKLNDSIEELKTYKGTISDSKKAEEVQQVIDAQELRKTQLNQRYQKAIETGDKGSYYRFNEFLQDKADNAANTYSYSKVVSLAADPYSLERTKHQYDMAEIQYRAQMKALYGDGDEDGSDIPDNAGTALQNGTFTPGVQMFQDMLQASGQEIETSMVEAAHLLGEEGDGSFRDKKFDLQVKDPKTGKYVPKVALFVPSHKMYDKKSGKFYVTGYANTQTDKPYTEQAAKQLGLIFAGEEIIERQKAGSTEKETVRVYNYRQQARREVKPSSQSSLVRNKYVYGTSKNGAALIKAQQLQEDYNEGLTTGRQFMGLIYPNGSITVATLQSHLSPASTNSKIAQKINLITNPQNKNAARQLATELYNSINSDFILNGKGSALAEEAGVMYNKKLQALMMLLPK